MSLRKIPSPHRVREGMFPLYKNLEVSMSNKEYILDQLHGYGYKKAEDIPDEMLDFIPENLELCDEEREARYLETLTLN